MRWTEEDERIVFLVLIRREVVENDDLTGVGYGHLPSFRLEFL